MDDRDIARFWSKVQKDGPVPAGRPELGPCWVWTGNTRKGYGYLLIGDDPKSAHRLSFALAFGPPPEGMLVRHQCDVARCVNPGHLLLGTRKDNARDMDARGRRGNRGERAGGAKLTEALVREIRASTESQRVLAKRLGVRASQIGKIRRREQWAHVT